MVQIALDGWTILSNKAADIAVGAPTFVTGVTISVLALRLAHFSPSAPARSAAIPLAEPKAV